MSNKVYQIRYQLSWMKEVNPGFFKVVFVHAENEQSAGGMFGTHLFSKDSFFEIKESSLVNEIVHMLEEELSSDSFTNSVDGIDEDLAKAIIYRVDDIHGSHQ